MTGTDVPPRDLRGWLVAYRRREGQSPTLREAWAAADLLRAADAAARSHRPSDRPDGFDPREVAVAPRVPQDGQDETGGHR